MKQACESPEGADAVLIGVELQVSPPASAARGEVRLTAGGEPDDVEEGPGEP